MASDQTLTVHLEADSTGFDKATQDAAKSLTDLKSEVDSLDAETAAITVDVDATAAQADISKVEASVESLDGTAVEIPANLELDRVQRNIANLQAMLQKVRAAQVTATADMDITPFLKDEARLEAALKKLEAQKVEITAGIDVDDTTASRLSSLSASLQGLDDQTNHMIPGLGAAGAGLSKMGVAGGGLLRVAGPIGVAISAWQFGEMAADMETLTVSLDTIFGSGEKALGVLREFAAATPFELPELANAALRLGGAGVKLEDIPETLTALGDAASALGAPLDQVVTAFAQMETKGKVTNEEMQQLTDANIPAYKILAEAMGVTVAQLQEMAAAGELGADKIDLLQQSLEKTFAGSMEKQSKTFNGQMSTLHDNFSQIGSDLGNIVLPTMTKFVELLNVGAGWVEKFTHNLDIFFNTNKAAGGMTPDAVQVARFGNNFEEAGDQVATTGDKMQVSALQGSALEKSFQDVMATIIDIDAAFIVASGATDDFSTTMHNLNTDMRNVNETFDAIVENFSSLKPNATSVEEAVVQLGDAFKGLKDSVKENGKDLSEFTQAGAANRIEIAKGIQAADAHAKAVLAEGGSIKQATTARRNDLEALRQHAVRAGLDADQVDRVIRALSKTPKQVRTEFDVIINEQKINDNIAKIKNLEKQKHKVEVKIDVATPTDPTARFLTTGEGSTPQQLRNKVVRIDTKVDGVRAANSDLQDVAKKRAAEIGIDIPDLSRSAQQLDNLAKERQALIRATVAADSLTAAEAQLANLARDRVSTITVNTVNTGGTGGGFTGTGQPLNLGGGAPTNNFAPNAANQIIGGSAETPFGTKQPTAGGGTVTTIAPKTYPLKVFLDGEEISQKVAIRTAAKFTPAGRGRRVP